MRKKANPAIVRTASGEFVPSPGSRQGTVPTIFAACALAAALLACRSGKPSGDQPASQATPTKARNPADAPADAPAKWHLSTWSAEELAARDVVWAQMVNDFSSQYSQPQWSAQQALDAPDVYPRHGDINQAWAPLAQDGGVEWIDVGFDEPRRVASVIVVQTFNPGAIIRIDDTTPTGAHRVLGRTTPTRYTSGKSAITELAFERPRTIRRLRVVMDTKAVPGWNELDAIGITLARP